MTLPENTVQSPYSSHVLWKLAKALPVGERCERLLETLSGFQPDSDATPNETRELLLGRAALAEAIRFVYRFGNLSSTSGRAALLFVIDRQLEGAFDEGARLTAIQLATGLKTVWPLRRAGSSAASHGSAASLHA